MFRKKHLKRRIPFSIAESSKVYETCAKTIPEQDELGYSVDRVVYVPVDVTTKEAMESLPTARDYSLENLLAAGVPLETLNVSKMFNPTDYATNSQLAENIVNSVNVESKNE